MWPLSRPIGKPIDATAHVPDEWDPKNDGYVFDFGTMWDQYKTTLPLVGTFDFVRLARMNSRS